MKTIKTTKQLRLDELIKHIFENSIKADKNLIKYHSNFDTVVEVDMSGQIAIYGRHYGNELFTVEVEEEITEDTVFEQCVTLLNNDFIFKSKLCNIKYIKEQYNDPIKIYVLIEGELQLIWERENQ